jgi:hypothetical protein
MFMPTYELLPSAGVAGVVPEDELREEPVVAV